ncbi:hypothetical protein ALP29_03637 [Pseudomonas syringae pv. avii]|uniref:Phage tail fibre protein N-terminal domain-containing protein n=1 Tax=Pseudomonas syringae pv. avii TaxID=663959 RepID=A0A3M5WB91_PSESX|nr:phage tail protein [Pseudomonas azotoformans]RMT70231.1 hypothetical protein ALP43_04253 [Pseudomonas azotoformans]RMU67278.1 hypothetical protein ALP29_03637 [Pseudomonas syringae pv. avii]
MIDENSQFFAILTQIGEAKHANSIALGLPWRLTQMGVGDANGTDPIPDRLQTSLIRERRRAPLNQLVDDPENPGLLIAEQVIPADEGGWWVRELGLYDEDDDLVAVANCAPSYKSLLSQGSGRTQVLRMTFIISSTDNVVLKIDPAVVLATRAYVDNLLKEYPSLLDLIEQLKGFAPINSPTFTGDPTTPTPALLDADKSIVNSEFVRQSQGNMAGYRNITINTNLPATDVGKFISVGAGLTPALPDAALLWDGAAIHFCATGNYAGFRVTNGTTLIVQGVEVEAPVRFVDRSYGMAFVRAGQWELFGFGAPLVNTLL